MPQASPYRSLFRRLPREQVESLQTTAIGLIAQGKTLMEVEGGGHKGTKVFPMRPDDVLSECNARLDALDGRRKRKSYSFFGCNGTGAGNFTS